MKAGLVVTAALLLMLAAPLSAQNVMVDYNHSTDFSKFHTYTWGSNNPNQIANSILAQTAKNAVDGQMQAKGLRLVAEAENPDVIVVANGGLKEQTSYNAGGTGGWRWGAGGMASVTPQTDYIGTLVVDLYDASAKQMVWRGVASGTMDQKSGEKNQQKINKAVNKMFQKYPGAKQ